MFKRGKVVHLLYRSVVHCDAFECTPQIHSIASKICSQSASLGQPFRIISRRMSLEEDEGDQCKSQRRRNGSHVFRTWASTAWLDTIAVILTGIILSIRAVKTLYRAICVVANIIDETWKDVTRCAIGMWMNVQKQHVSITFVCLDRTLAQFPLWWCQTGSVE